MIAVYSDDFTGAAEIGGICIRHGFKVIIDTQVNGNYNCDVLIIATNSRSQDINTAEREVRKHTAALLTLKPSLIFKKIDSVLRGKTGAELIIQMGILNKKKALLIPANPNLNRTIENGVYYFKGVPLMESNFFSNRDEIATSSSVFSLLGEKYRNITYVRDHDMVLNDSGLIVGNTLTELDVDSWVNRIDEDTLPAGGASFFNAILKKRIGNKERPKEDFTLENKSIKTLYVCGSNFLLSRAAVRQADENGQMVSFMPRSIFCYSDNETYINSWSQKIITKLKENDKVIIAIDKLECKDAENLSEKICETFATVVQTVLKNIQLDELIIEGGATSYAIINKLVYKKFYPQQELSPGVIRMKIEQNDSLLLTLKPGSYQWPPIIWNF